MRHGKKLISIFTVVFMSLAFTGCGNNGNVSVKGNILPENSAAPTYEINNNPLFASQKPEYECIRICSLKMEDYNDKDDVPQGEQIIESFGWKLVEEEIAVINDASVVMRVMSMFNDWIPEKNISRESIDGHSKCSVHFGDALTILVPIPFASPEMYLIVIEDKYYNAPHDFAVWFSEYYNALALD